MDKPIRDQPATVGGSTVNEAYYSIAGSSIVITGVLPQKTQSIHWIAFLVVFLVGCFTGYVAYGLILREMIVRKQR